MYRAVCGPSHRPSSRGRRAPFLASAPLPSVSNAVVFAARYASATASAIASASAHRRRRRARQSPSPPPSHRLSNSRRASPASPGAASARVHVRYSNARRFHRDARPRPVPASRRPREHARVGRRGARRGAGVDTGRRSVARRRGNRGGGVTPRAGVGGARATTPDRATITTACARKATMNRPHARRHVVTSRRVRLSTRRPALRDEDPSVAPS